MPKQILLARPHPFIVAEVKPFGAHGFEALSPEGGQSLVHWRATALAPSSR